MWQPCNVKGKKLWKLAAGIILAAFFSAAVWMLWPAPEPVYRGKPLSYWLDGLRPGFRGPQSIADSQNALRAAGTNAVPTLLKMLAARDSKVAEWLHRMSRKQNVFNWHHMFAFEQNLTAVFGFQALPPEALRGLVPSLIAIYDQPGQNVGPRQSVTKVLATMGWEAKEAVPYLAHDVTNDLTAVHRILAANTLGELRLRPEIAVPALVAALGDTNADVQLQSVFALAQFGSAARSAVPSLRLLIPPLVASNGNSPNSTGLLPETLAPSVRVSRPGAMLPVSKALSVSAAVKIAIEAIESSAPGRELDRL